MQKSQISLDELVKQLINTQTYNEGKMKRKNSSKLSQQQPNQQIQSLDIEDYLQLFANQKKHLSNRRWAKLNSINQSLQMQQESFKHFFSIASQANYRRLEHPGYYKLILSIAKTYPPSFFVAIQKDIPRTLSSTNPFQELLKNVLYAYAIRNPSLLYCQGINYIVAYLLMNQMSEEQTFWFLACLIENFLPDDYFKDLTTVSITTCIFNILLQEVFPQFKFEMNQVGMEPSIFLTPWFVCLFTKGFINSVSAYLLNYILLQTRKYKIGYVLLRISLALISVAITKQDSICFNKDFRTFKDIIQTRAFEVSLEQIQQSLQLAELNYQAYLKIESYFRKEKEETREEILKNRSKKIPLPPCNTDYPVCFHRIQMQKRLGCIENAFIFKNGYNLKDQIINNYLDEDHSEDTTNIHYTEINECTMGRLSHICHLNTQDINTRRLKLQRQTTHKIQIIGEDEASQEQEVQLSTLEERFAQHSEYFQIDQNYIENQLNCDEEFKRELQQFSIQRKIQQKKQQECMQDTKKDEIKEKVSITAKVGSVFRKIMQKINDMKKVKQIRKSQAEIVSPKKQNKHNIII